MTRQTILEEDIERGLKKADRNFAAMLQRARDAAKPEATGKLKQVFADAATVDSAEAAARKIIGEFKSLLEIARQSKDRNGVWTAVECLKLIAARESPAVKFLADGYRFGFTEGFEVHSRNPNLQCIGGSFQHTQKVTIDADALLRALRDFKPDQEP